MDHKDTKVHIYKVFLVFILNQWIRTGSHPYKKTMYSIVLYQVFYKYRNVQSQD